MLGVGKLSANKCVAMSVRLYRIAVKALFPERAMVVDLVHLSYWFGYCCTGPTGSGSCPDSTCYTDSSKTTEATMAKPPFSGDWMDFESINSRTQ